MYIQLKTTIPQWASLSLSSLLVFLAVGCQDTNSSIGVEPEPTVGTCEPNTTFTTDDGCNVCTCPNSGMYNENTCTQMTCETYNPCQEKRCGDTCQSCDPTDMTCEETAEVKVCNAGGQCMDSEIVSCETDLCADVTCGDSGPSSCDGNIALPAWSSMCDPNTGACLPTSEATAQDCSAEGRICTDGVCVALEADACVPGEIFDAGDECNTCECPDSGLKIEAICTDMVCQEEANFLAVEGNWSYSSFDAGVSSCEGVKDDIASSLSDDKGFALSNVTVMGLNWGIDGLPEASNCGLSERSVNCDPLTGNIDNDYGLTLPTVIDITGHFDDESNVSGTYTANINCEGDLCTTIELIYSISFPCTFDFNFVAGSN